MCDKIKELATIKRVHDRLHCIRQFGISPWHSVLLSLWTDGSIDTDAIVRYGDILGVVSTQIQRLEDLKPFLPLDQDRLANGMQMVLDFKIASKEDLKSIERKTFVELVDDFGRLVQRAFALADEAMQDCTKRLRRQYEILSKCLSEARDTRALSVDQTGRLNNTLNGVEHRLDEMDTVFDRHRDWQRLHNELEAIDLGTNDQFKALLGSFLRGNRRIVSDLLEGATSALASEDQRMLLSDIKAIEALLSVELDQTESDIAAHLYQGMRKGFDDLFFKIDKASLRFVEQSEDTVKAYETALDNLPNELCGPTGAIA
jgi:hypothetical protein